MQCRDPPYRRSAARLGATEAAASEAADATGRLEGHADELWRSPLVAPLPGPPRTPPVSRSPSSSRLSALLRPLSRASQRSHEADHRRRLLEEEAAATNDVAQRATLATSYETHSPYGFVIYLLSGVGYVLFLIWAYTPDDVLRAWGVSWYPNREWALLLPAWLCTAVVYVYVAFASYAIWTSPPPDALNTLSDGFAIVSPLPRPETGGPVSLAHAYAGLDADRLPPLQDVPVGLANRLYFGDFRRGLVDDTAPTER